MVLIFMPIVNTSAEFANVYFTVSHELTIPLIILACVIIFSGGILANLFVLYLSFFSPLVTGSFKYFMGNLAFCDLCFNLSLIFAAFFQLYHDLMNVPYTAKTMSIPIMLPWVMIYCIFLAATLTNINRYVVIVMGRNDWFTKRRVFLLCVCSYLPVTMALVDFLFASYVINFIYNDLFIVYEPFIHDVCDILYKLKNFRQPCVELPI
jgi:hypothetical protein